MALSLHIGRHRGMSRRPGNGIFSSPPIITKLKIEGKKAQCQRRRKERIQNIYLNGCTIE